MKPKMVLSVSTYDVEETIKLTKEFLRSLDCIEDVVVNDDGTFKYTHKWSGFRFLVESIKQWFMGDYRPGLDVPAALQDHLIREGIESQLLR